MVEYKKGDVLNSGEKIVVHGCNCFKAMGAGIAAQVRKECPNAYKADQETLWGDKTKLGTFTFGVEENGVTVVNAYTQYKYSRTERMADYDAIRSALTKICEKFTNEVIAMPKIGCGLAGGDWNIVSKILEEVSNKHNRIFCVYELDGNLSDGRH